ncbi:unnamed protein product [Protopolystoma xenopodis]|uniref:Uncharacterized protein n=1 Tax=Protopolystoma xenopodis TaxID=117903 RepID=A0A448X7V6_9PLAT|nr:unnamed protein product [Protopolystoma xenopodis]
MSCFCNRGEHNVVLCCMKGMGEGEATDGCGWRGDDASIDAVLISDQSKPPSSGEQVSSCLSLGETVIGLINPFPDEGPIKPDDGRDLTRDGEPVEEQWEDKVSRRGPDEEFMDSEDRDAKIKSSASG